MFIAILIRMQHHQWSFPPVRISDDLDWLNSFDIYFRAETEIN